MTNPNWLVLGDTHGSDSIIKIDQWATQQGISTIIQTGDFGIHWPPGECKYYKYFRKRALRGRAGPTWYTCGGNHDNYDRIAYLRQQGRTDGSLVEYAKGCYYVERGHVITIDGHKVFFLGGAVSSDGQHRMEARGSAWKRNLKLPPTYRKGAWWPEEAPTQEELQFGLAQVDLHAPSIWITHDVHDTHKPYCRGSDPNPLSGRLTDETSCALRQLFQAADHRPSWWFHGHYHQYHITELDGTKFVNCGITHPHRGRKIEQGVLFNPHTQELQSFKIH